MDGKDLISRRSFDVLRLASSVTPAAALECQEDGGTRSFA